MRLLMTASLHALVREHLRGEVEQAGFFLAEWQESAAAFVVRDWRPLRREAGELETSWIVSLTDEARISVIQWATREGLCLVEIHSHGDDGTACFSGMDRRGFDEWVPQLWWRLNGRPYAALVTGSNEIEGWGWVDGPQKPVQITSIDLDDGSVIPTTGFTLAWLESANDR